MSNVQIRDVPESTMAALRCTAAARGQSLQRYLLAVLTEQARIDATAAVLADAADDAHHGDTATFDAAEWVRVAREERVNELAARHSQ